MRQTIRITSSAFLKFFTAETAGGILLLLCAALALLLANSPLAARYEAALALPVTLGTGTLSLTLPAEHWVNDGLMTLFFLTIGLEVKREFLYGELRTPTAMLLPVCAALAGMLVPALLFTLVNTGTATAGGWGIPMATDIAFALGVLRLVAPRAPLGLVVFLTALAIVDDLGAIVVIALFYSSEISFAALGLGLAALLLAALLGRAAENHAQKKAARPPRRLLLLYLPLGLSAWLAFLSSGIHPTIAGVLLGFTLPAHHLPERSLLHAVEERLEPLSSYLVMPLFALANAGIPLTHEGELLLSPASPLTLGIAAGLVLGKPLGIYGSVRLLTHATGTPLPGGATPRQTLAAACLAGIGFTMSIFIATLAFESPQTLATAKLSVLCASLLAVLLGTLVFRTAK